MFEEWAWSYDTLARFAQHHETGEVIPKELVEKMRRADKFGLGTRDRAADVLRGDLARASTAPIPSKLDQLGEVQAAAEAVHAVRVRRRARKFHASFGHLVGYSAMYYTYHWSLVIAKDLLTPFEKTGLMATDVTLRVPRQGPRARRQPRTPRSS